jgi:proteic killer suppression protein
VDGRVKPGHDETWRLVFRWDGSRGEAEGVYLDDHSYR